MKCCIIIMGCQVNPALRNMEAIYNSYITLYNERKRDFNHSYDFYFYDGGNEKFEVSKYKKYANIIHCVSGDDIENTYQKSIEAYKWIIKNKTYDWIIRVNISTYVNMFVLDKFLNCVNDETIYANMFCAYLHNYHYLNDCFPRGDAHIIPFSILKKAVSNSNNFDIDKINEGIDKVDDVLMGMLYMESFNDLYIKHYCMINYNFLPHEIKVINEPKYRDCFDNSLYFIFTRLKTCPSNTTSGYSCTDNEYRKQDIIKFDFVNRLVSKHCEQYKDIEDEKVYECIIRDANIKPYIPYLNLKNTALQIEAIDFEGLKDIIIKKHSSSIIY